MYIYRSFTLNSEWKTESSWDFASWQNLLEILSNFYLDAGHGEKVWNEMEKFSFVSISFHIKSSFAFSSSCIFYLPKPLDNFASWEGRNCVVQWKVKGRYEETCKMFWIQTRENFFLLHSSGNLFFLIFLLILEEKMKVEKGNEDLSEIDNDPDENVSP